MDHTLKSSDARDTLKELSSIVLQPGQNPYNVLIERCDNDPSKIQQLYSLHRTRRNGLQREKYIAPDFKELDIDQVLLRLERPELEPGFVDPRNCMVFWGRPPIPVLELAETIQKKLQACAPNLWLMPTHRMHITVMEITHSRTGQEIEGIKNLLRPAIPAAADYTYTHRARLVKPMVSYDLSAFALSFLPASGEPPLSPPPMEPDNAAVLEQGDGYSYHHLRRDVWDLVNKAGSEINSRYVVPSAHITLGRFLTNDDHLTLEQREKWVDAIDEINRWLESEVWDNSKSEVKGEWIVGQERGLDVRIGQLWYGGGRSIAAGEGF